LKGDTELPTPAVAVAFKSFPLDPNNRLQTGIQIADTGLQHGQGMHGSLARDNTFNNMAAMGPDFKQGFVDRSPVSNADVPQTIAHILGLRMSKRGLAGRVIEEALVGGPDSVQADSWTAVSSAATSGTQTVLRYQTVGSQIYLDEACFLTGAVDLTDPTNSPCAPTAAPVLYSTSDGTGQGVIWHASTGQIASAANPATAGEWLSLYSKITSDPSGTLPQVTIGGVTAITVAWADAPGFPGYKQINFIVPSGITPGSSVPVQVGYLGRLSNQVTIGVR
jgi:hypothetical protein